MLRVLSGSCEVLINSEKERYSEAVENLASNVVSLFGTNNYSDIFVDVGNDFDKQSFCNLLNKEEIELIRFRIVEIGNSKKEYNVTSPHAYPDESVAVNFSGDEALISHRINRLD